MVENQRQRKVKNESWSSDEGIKIVDARGSSHYDQSVDAWKIKQTYSAEHAISQQIAIIQPRIGSVRPSHPASRSPYPTFFPPIQAHEYELHRTSPYIPRTVGRPAISRQSMIIPGNVKCTREMRAVKLLTNVSSSSFIV